MSLDTDLADSVSARNGGTSPASSRTCGAFLFLWRSAWRCRFSAGGSIRPCSSPVPVYRQSLFARGAHDRESARLARRVSVPVPASAPVPREARSAVADHHRTAACMRDRRLNESTGTHGGPRRGCDCAASFVESGGAPCLDRIAVRSTHRACVDRLHGAGLLAGRDNRSPHGPVRKRRARCAE